MPEAQKPVRNYVGNSHKQREGAKSEGAEPKKVEKVTKGSAVQRKKSLGRKIADTFTGADAKGVFVFVIMDVVVPQLKTAISDAASQGVERYLFGESRPRSGSVRSASGYTSYNRMAPQSRVRDEPRAFSQQARRVHDFDEIILENRGEADAVLEALSLLVEQYGMATVADLYELVGITGAFTDDKYGWLSLAGSGAHRVRQGYLLDLPRTVPLD